jgi:fatty-acyl-CoA synthase
MELDSLMLYRQPQSLARRSDKGHTYIGPGETALYRTYAELMADARRMHAHFFERGVRPGDRVALVASDTRSFIPAFVGGVLAGAALVPLAALPVGGQRQNYSTLVYKIARLAEVGTIIAPTSLQTLFEGLCGHAVFVSYEELKAPAPVQPTPARLSPESTCFLQFTSGSTGDPKGVVVSYRNLAANCRAIMEHGLLINDGDVGVSWLPLHHDMGLIGKVLAPLTYPTEMVYLSTSAFIKNPNLWLQTVSRFKGTITFGPNFAFAHVVKHFKRRPVELDLSSLRVLGCGAEPINPEVLNEFASTFAPHGLRPGAIMPSYGMAEATLAVSFSSTWRELAIDRKAFEAQHQAVVVPASNAPTSGQLRLVSCGGPFVNHDIAIIGPRGTRLADGKVGEIVVKGPSVTAGYFRNQTATAAAFADGWLKTGDLGVLLDGELYVCGRIKDLIIVNGRNYCPQDIEWLVETLPGVRSGSVVACAVPGHGTEQVVILAEVRRQEPGANLSAEIRRLVAAEFGFIVRDAVILPPGSIPKTTSGKVQRAKARANYANYTNT